MKQSFPVIALILFLLADSTLAQSEGYFATPDKVRIFYKIVGTGTDTLVAVHGGPGNSLESIRADLEPMANGRRVIYYDQRGQGRSELIKDGSKLGYEQHVADLDAVRAHFKLESMTLYGNSWGGLLISLYAIAHPDRVERMILHSPAPPTKGLLTDMDDEISRRMEILYKPEQLERAGSLNRGWSKSKDPLATCREFYPMVLAVYTYSRTWDIGFKSNLCVGGKESVRQQQTVRGHVWRSLGDFNILPKITAVKAPVLVIHGIADVIPQRASEFYASGYPNAKLLVIEKAGHISHVETPEIFFSAIDSFFKGSFPEGAKKVEPRSRP